MAFRLEKEKTRTSPYILIDEDKSYMRFEGESYLEEVIVFFTDINEWLEEYFKTDFEAFTFDCAMDYFNSSTTKILYNILRFMDTNTNEKKITVNWIINDEEDDILIECGEDFQDEMENLEFNMIVG